jgi:hypothetical protein
LALYPNAAHQRFIGCADAAHIFLLEHTAVNHDPIYSIEVTSPMATIPGEAGLTKSNYCFGNRI